MRFLIVIGIICGLVLHAKEVSLTIFTLNDLYEIKSSNNLGGLAEMMTILKNEREKSEHYLTTINGDFLSPSLVSSIFMGSQMIDLFNMMEVDVVVFGNHEFDYGMDVLKKRMDESNFYWLGSNIFSEHRGKLLGKAHSTLIFEVDGIQVGMLGILTPETSTLARDAKEVIFAPIVISAQAAVHNLKQAGADIIIALTHLNMEEDLYLAKYVPEIDIILGGHDHEVFTYYDGKTFIHKSGHDAQFLCRLDLKMEKFTKGEKEKIVYYPSWKMIPNHGFEQDPETAKRVEYYSDRIDYELKQPIGICTTDLESEYLREKESTMGDLFADALRSMLKADLAIINSGSIRGNVSFSKGMTLTKFDVLKQLPFGNIGVLVETTGQQIINTLEMSLSHIEQKSGAFPQVSGLKVIYDEDASPGERIIEILVGNVPIDPNAIYRVATNDYLLKGGDGNIGLFGSKVLIGPSSGDLISQVVVNYVLQEQMIQPLLIGRLVKSDLALEVTKVGREGKRIQFKIE